MLPKEERFNFPIKMTEGNCMLRVLEVKHKSKSQRPVIPLDAKNLEKQPFKAATIEKLYKNNIFKSPLNST